MKKLKLYIAVSLDGKIAGPNGEVDWLEQIPNPDKTDYGYGDFLNSIDTTVMGNDTYKEVLKLSKTFPYHNLTNYVLTRNRMLKENQHVKFISEDPVSFIRNLKQGEGKDIWLIGGGQVNTLLQKENLIDEYLIFMMPIILGEGIPLFAQHPKKEFLKLTKSESYSSGVVSQLYQNLTR